MSDYSQVVIERFCQAHRFEYRLADGAREAVDPTSGLVTVATYFIAQRSMHFFPREFPTPWNFLSRTRTRFLVVSNQCDCTSAVVSDRWIKSKSSRRTWSGENFQKHPSLLLIKKIFFFPVRTGQICALPVMWWRKRNYKSAIASSVSRKYKVWINCKLTKRSLFWLLNDTKILYTETSRAVI